MTGLPSSGRPDDFGLRVRPGWPAFPAGLAHRDVADVAVDSADRVHLFTRHDSQVVVFDRDGGFVRCFGAGLFRMAHGIAIDGEDCVYCVDNVDHTVRKFSPTGELLLTLGTPGVAAETGKRAAGPVVIHGVERVRYPGPPFGGCTDVAIAANGDLFVSDGYGNCRVHHFSPTGELLHSWGEVGEGPGEFRLPHAIVSTVDGRLLVADRENDRIQVFAADGTFLDAWTGLQRPTDLAVAADGRIYVSELWRPPGNRGFVDGTDAALDQPSRMSILDSDGRLLGRFGASVTDRAAPGNFVAPHGVCLDSTGALYVAEVTYTFAIATHLVSPDHAEHQVQKFVRTPSNETPSNEETPA
jgi:sugar lactone lactonase YvrE